MNALVLKSVVVTSVPTVALGDAHSYSPLVLILNANVLVEGAVNVAYAQQISTAIIN